MQLLKVYYAYFSPGNTTEKVLSQIASSFENYPVESINLTSYDERQQEHHFKEMNFSSLVFRRMAAEFLFQSSMH